MFRRLAISVVVLSCMLIASACIFSESGTGSNNTNLDDAGDDSSVADGASDSEATDSTDGDTSSPEDALDSEDLSCEQSGCEDNTPFECVQNSDTGQYEKRFGEACGMHANCELEGSVPTCVCNHECQLGEARCETSTGEPGYDACETDPQDCRYWAPGDCSSFPGQQGTVPIGCSPGGGETVCDLAANACTTRTCSDGSCRLSSGSCGGD